MTEIDQISKKKKKCKKLKVVDIVQTDCPKSEDKVHPITGNEGSEEEQV